jgi:hypothetical protein
MTRDEVVGRLRPHEPELRSSGLAALYLFGSTARGEAREDSDVDILCDLDDAGNVGLLEFIDLQERISSFLHRPVDLVERRSLRPRIRTRVERELVRIF